MQYKTASCLPDSKWSFMPKILIPHPNLITFNIAATLIAGIFFYHEKSPKKMPPDMLLVVQFVLNFQCESCQDT